jgi:hypothetical protein
VSLVIVSQSENSMVAFGTIALGRSPKAVTLPDVLASIGLMMCLALYAHAF